jgi:hypothetical protein
MEWPIKAKVNFEDLSKAIKDAMKKVSSDKEKSTC